MRNAGTVFVTCILFHLVVAGVGIEVGVDPHYDTLHTKPLGLLDTEGFYRPLLAFLAHLAEEDFVTRDQLAHLRVADDPHRLLDLLAEELPPPVAKWTHVERF